MDVLKKQIVPVTFILTAFLYVIVAGFTSMFGAVISTLLSNLVLIAGFTYLYIYDRRKDDYVEPIDESLIKTYYKRDIITSYALIVALWFIGQFVFLWVYKTYGDTTYTGRYAENFGNPSVIVFTILLVGIVAPIAEELLFRYVLFGRFMFKKGIKVGVIKYLFLHLLSTSLFALIHGTLVHLIAVVPLSLLLGMLYYKTNRIVYPILGHMLFNNMSIWLGALISGYNNLFDNLIVVFAFIAMYVSLIVTILYFVWSRRKN